LEQWGKRRMKGNCTLQNNNSIQDLVESEENGYPLPDLNKTMLNVLMNPVIPTNYPSKRKSWERSLRNSWKRY
jgi:hypothetical protein